ncbi:hypothetical protein IFM89_013051, partial [Coptis chinensis]
VSLLHLADITEQGVTFQLCLLLIFRLLTTFHFHPMTPHKRPNEQNLFGIVQGGLDPVQITLLLMFSRHVLIPEIYVLEAWLIAIYLDIYAIGGLAGGEDNDSIWRVVAQCTAALPDDKPRYVMGVGYPLDIVGADMYDCVYPTRTARFGTALVPEVGGTETKAQGNMADDARPIDPTCTCMGLAHVQSSAAVSRVCSPSLLVISNFLVDNICLFVDFCKKWYFTVHTS